MSEKFINIYCWKCGHKHELADNGWNAILCLSCEAEILHPNEAAQQSVQGDVLNYCPCHLPQVHGHLEKNCPKYNSRA